MFYIGANGEIVMKQCEKCGDPFGYVSDGIWQPLTCQDCFLVDGIDYVKSWDVVLVNEDAKHYTIPLGVSLKDALETKYSCMGEIQKGAKMAKGWVEVYVIAQGYPTIKPYMNKSSKNCPIRKCQN